MPFSLTSEVCGCFHFLQYYTAILLLFLQEFQQYYVLSSRLIEFSKWTRPTSNTTTRLIRSYLKLFLCAQGSKFCLHAEKSHMSSFRTKAYLIIRWRQLFGKERLLRGLFLSLQLINVDICTPKMITHSSQDYYCCLAVCAWKFALI